MVGGKVLDDVEEGLGWMIVTLDGIGSTHTYVWMYLRLSTLSLKLSLRASGWICS